jgi:lipoprotein-anchoring transpeptidase ErfK/SrfK
MLNLSGLRAIAARSMKRNVLVQTLLLAVVFVVSTSIVNTRLKGFDPNEELVSGGSHSYAVTSKGLSGEYDHSAQVAFFNEREITVPPYVADEETRAVLGVASEERWVEVDLSEQKLLAWEGDKLFLESLVATGLPWWPTPTGEFRIWIKLRATKMEGGQGRYYYYLPNVPYVMYFGNNEVPNWRGYGLHGTYWHNDFGTQRSHGCVNLPTEIAKELYYWTGPVLAGGKSIVYSDESNPGTRIVIHE